MSNYQVPRVPHIIKPLKRTSFPQNLLFFDTETKTQKLGGKEQRQRLTLLFGFAKAYRLEHGEVLRETSTFFTNPAQFFEFAIGRILDNKPLYCFAHNLPFDATQVDLWHGLSRYGLQVEMLIFDDPPNYIKLRHKKGLIIFIDTFNYFKCTVKKLGESVGIPKLEAPKVMVDTPETRKYCQTDVEIISEATKRMISWLYKNDYGSFGISIASVALHVFKHKFMQHQIYIHDRDKILKLERQSYYGGIVINHFVGTVKSGPIYKLDVNSLYPTMMLYPQPVKHLQTLKNPSIATVKAIMKEQGVVAECLLDARKGTYPKRYNGKLCEVMGRIHTVIAGPELERAIRDNELRQVRILATYEMQPIFVDYVKHFYQRRLEYKQQGDDANQLFCKYMLNSLYGKFGQRASKWRELSEVSIQEYCCMKDIPIPIFSDNELNFRQLRTGSFPWFTPKLKEPLPIRCLNGYAEIKVPEGEHHESCPIIASYVTAYAREHLRRLSSIAGRRQVYYCDTDSLFTTTRGYQSLLQNGEMDESTLGKLKIEKVSDRATFRCPKDYIYDGARTSKGIRADAKPTKDGGMAQQQFEGLKSILRRGGSAYLDIKTIVKHNSGKYTKGQVTQSGWVDPFVLSDW